MLPERLNPDGASKFTGLLGVYIFSEVEALNEIIGYLGDEVDKALIALRSGVHSDNYHKTSSTRMETENTHQLFHNSPLLLISCHRETRSAHAMPPKRTSLHIRHATP